MFWTISGIIPLIAYAGIAAADVASDPIKLVLLGCAAFANLMSMKEINQVLSERRERYKRAAELRGLPWPPKRRWGWFVVRIAIMSGIMLAIVSFSRELLPKGVERIVFEYLSLCAAAEIGIMIPSARYDLPCG
jgi:hypothetical protein